ncbi:MAG: phage tail tape measure protein, partial [Spirochaetales bacterium]|nr:phage tail tape measure protein [Spirochaetales bacterium]
MNESTLQIAIEVDDNGSIKIRQLGRELDQTGKQGQRSFALLERGGNLAGKAILGATVGAGALFTALSVQGVRAFAAFETGMIGVQKTTDFTGQEMETFRGEIEGISRTVPVATESLLGIAGVAGQLGIKGVDNVTRFTATLGQLQLATDVVGDEGAAQIARLLTVVDEGYENVDNFGDVLVALGNNSAATESEILGLATEVAQATSTFSVGSTEALGMAAAMKSLGVRAELGGSVVGRSMRSIEAAIEAGGEKIAHLSKVTGIAEGELKSAFGDDATAVFQKWLVGIGGVIDGGTSAANALEAFGLKGEEVLKVLPTMAVNSGVLQKALQLANVEVERGTALDIEAGKASESLASQWQVTKNRANEISVAVGEGLAPVISGVLADFGDWYDTNELVIKQDIAGFLSNITPVVSSLAGSMGDLVKSMAGWAAFGSGDLGFIVFASKNDEELEQWLHKSAIGVVELESRLGNLAEARKEVAESWALTSSERKAKVERLGALDLEIETIHNLAEVIEEDYRDPWMGTLEEVSKKHEKEIKERVVREKEASKASLTLIKAGEKQKRVVLAESSAKALEAEIRASEDRADLADQLSDKTKKLTLTDYQYKKWALGEEISDLKEKAGDDLQLRKGITNYQLAALGYIEKANKKATDNMSDEWKDFGNDMKHTFTSGVGDVIMESFGEIDNAWEGMWASMLSTLGEKTAEMAVDWVASGVSSLFDGWDIFHDGSWDVDSA